MKPFTPHSKTLHGGLEVAASIDEAFPLFSPAGERLWVPGWEPEHLHPPGVEWAEGQIFRTHDHHGEAIWVVTKLDPEHHVAEYHRVEPGRYVARITVRCAATAAGHTTVSTEYGFIGLSEDGNAEIAAMTQADYDAKMERWAEWIEQHHASRGEVKG